MLCYRCPKATSQHTNLGFHLSFLKRAWDLDYPEQNLDVREIFKKCAVYKISNSRF